MVRDPIVAGILYPSEPQILKKRVQRLLMEAPVIAGNAGAMILPYGHYDNVGALIASGMKRAAAGTPKRILLLASPSSETAEGIFVPGVSAFATPIGRLPVDEEAIARFLSAGASADDLLHLREHILEPHLPFVRHLFPSIPIVPLLVGVRDADNLQTVTRIIASLGEQFFEESLFIVSSNISSFCEAREATLQSKRVIGAALAHDAARLVHSYRRSLFLEAGPIAVLCNLLASDTRASILGRTAHHSYADGRLFSVEHATIVFDVKD